MTGTYCIRKWGAFRPYSGLGAAYAIILKDHDAAVSHLIVRNNFGIVLQGRAEYRLGKKWEIFADYKKLWLAVNAHGLLSGAVPVTAHAKLNPSLISAGIKFHFHFGIGP